MTYKNSKNKYATFSQAAEILGVSPATVRNWKKLGKLPSESKSESILLSDVLSLKKSPEMGKMLRSRRNKSNSENNFIPVSYINPSSQNFKTCKDIIKALSGVLCSAESVLVFYARMLLANLNIPESISDKLTEDLGSCPREIKEILSGFRLYPVPGEDILGMLYISLRKMTEKKRSGSYYTPYFAVDELIKSSFERSESFLNPSGRTSFLNSDTDAIVYDPACGSGNFLIRLPEEIKLENIKGSDIDNTAVILARINLALRYGISTKKELAIILKNIFCADYLSEKKLDFKPDIIIGNPPWGYGYDKKEISELKRIYPDLLQSNAKPESFSLFIEKSLTLLSDKGIICFLLPMTILSADIHRQIRTNILKSGDVFLISYLGDIFDKVQCPCIILGIKFGKKETQEPVDVAFYKSGKKTIAKTRSFSAYGKRLDSDSFHLLCNEEEYALIKKIEATPHITLKGNAIFGLGIVTGSNKTLLHDSASPGFEGVIRGSDIEKYRIKEPSKYLEFTPEKFQQVAPPELYRTSPKLLYRFIAKEPVFAMDRLGRLSINSANFLIPTAEGFLPEYIMAVLNSDVISFYHRNTCPDVKVLRSYIESLPIPCCDMSIQNEIASLVNEDDIKYTQINDYIFKLFNISEKDSLLLQFKVLM